MKLFAELPVRFLLVILIACPITLAQQGDEVRGMKGRLRNGNVVSGSVLLADTGLEMNRLVTGQPYSAEQTSERRQTLADGTHIDQKREMQVMYRDSEGRTGNSVLRTQVLDRTEPDPELFRVPPDYTIVEEEAPFVVGFKAMTPNPR